MQMAGNAATPTVFVGASQTHCEVIRPEAFTCVGVYDDNYAALDEHCQPIVP
jgi:hypothetical protein